MKVLLKQVPDVDSVFCATDNIAIGAMTYLKEIGKSIPQDVQLGGVGDTPLSRLVTPSISTVHLYYKTSGMEAATMLVERMEMDSVINKELKMGYEVVLGESVRV